MEPPVATGYDPLRDTAPELARTMAASVQQRIAFGERAGQHVRRIGSGFGSEGEAPRLTGPRCASVHGFSLHANTADPRAPARSVGTAHPLYRPWCRVAGAPPGRRQRRSRLYLHPSVVGRHHGDSPLAGGTPGEAGGVSPPAARPSGALWGLSGAAQPPARGDHPHATSAGDGRAGDAHGSPTGAGRGCCSGSLALEMATCPFCQRGTLRLIAVITQGEVIRKILRHLKRRCRPAPHCACSCSPRDLRVRLSPHRGVGLGGDVRAVQGSLTPLCVAMPCVIPLVPPGHPCGARHQLTSCRTARAVQWTAPAGRRQMCFEFPIHYETPLVACVPRAAPLLPGHPSGSDPPHSRPPTLSI